MDRALARSGEAYLAESYLVAIGADLRADRELLEEYADSLHEQLRFADFLVEWSAGEQAGSSATRFEALALLGRGKRPPEARRDSFDDLRFTERAGLLPDPRLRETLVRYHSRMVELRHTGDDDVRTLTNWLDEQLDPGHWAFWQGRAEPGSHPIDFRRTSVKLREAGLLGPARTARRGLEARWEALSEVVQLNRVLIGAVETVLDE